MIFSFRTHFVRVFAVSGMIAAFSPGIAEATEVDPAIMARFKQFAPAEDRSAPLDEERLIEKGRRLFMDETFEGNGRTCATCHPPANNFTIDPAFIADLPGDDPLFVAEFDPDLADLEDPDLMRRFGLIKENLDGFDKPGVFRGVPHTLALPTSIAPDDDDDSDQVRADGSTVVNATGWSADGAPGDGSLRSFAIGAVIQHFPKTLNRIPGEDFRLPTESELDALEAFQLSLGRQTELELETIDFADPDVQAGKDLFNGVGINRACAFCHANAGANTADGFNDNFVTNVTGLLETAPRRFDPALPGDGGFDREPVFTAPGIVGELRGNGTMNTPPLVEAADTGPFFHNNSADTIEDAIRFYTTPTFSADDPFQLDDLQIDQVAAFLRALNALENIRSSNAYSEEAQREWQWRARRMIDLILADTEDAREVLRGGPLDLYPEAVELLDEAYDLERHARHSHRFERKALLREAAALKDEARALILK